MSVRRVSVVCVRRVPYTPNTHNTNDVTRNVDVGSRFRSNSSTSRIIQCSRAYKHAPARPFIVENSNESFLQVCGGGEIHSCWMKSTKSSEKWQFHMYFEWNTTCLRWRSPFVRFANKSCSFCCCCNYRWHAQVKSSHLCSWKACVVHELEHEWHRGSRCLFLECYLLRSEILLLREYVGRNQKARCVSTLDVEEQRSGKFVKNVKRKKKLNYICVTWTMGPNNNSEMSLARISFDFSHFLHCLL